MTSILEALAAVLIKWLSAWIEYRVSKRIAADEQATRDIATTQAEQIRDQASAQVEQSDADTQAAIDRMAHRPPGPNRLRDDAADVNAAIAAANSVREP